MAVQAEDMLMMARTEGDEHASTLLPFPNTVGKEVTIVRAIS
jgi:hypothetical protein